MWFMALAFGIWYNMRSGRATRGKKRISDGKGGSGLFSYLEI
jgi:hypothetical protein